MLWYACDTNIAVRAQHHCQKAQRCYRCCVKADQTPWHDIAIRAQHSYLEEVRDRVVANTKLEFVDVGSPVRKHLAPHDNWEINHVVCVDTRNAIQTSVCPKPSPFANGT
eukprot:2989826-Rhodomonas_salina.1